MQANWRIISPKLLLPLSSKVGKQLDLYKAEKSPDLDSNPLVWWNAKDYFIDNRYVQTGKKYFVFVATSVSLEHLNTLLLLTNTPENVVKLIFLHKHHRL